MKKIFVSIGLAAAGTASLHAFDLLGTENDKIWNVSASLRGFYDDNYLTTPHKSSSLGFEVNPSFELNAPLPQTQISLRYNYGLYYYQKREQNHQNPIDQTHQFDLWIDHAFDPRWDLQVEDSVTVAQDPALTTSPTAVAQRVSGNNLANTANLNLHTDWSQRLSTLVSYQNTFYLYDNSGADTNSLPNVNASYVGLLNRVEQTMGLEGQWHFSPTTVGSVGYKLGLVNYTGDEIIAYDPVSEKFYKSDSRDNYSHYGYAGVQHDFLENLTGEAKVGVQYTDYYNDPSATSSLGPYADMSLVYTYAPGGYAQIGFTETRNATDTVNVDSSGHITQDQESSVLYASINHPITPKLTGSLVGHYQYSTYNNGEFGDQSSSFYNLGLDLTFAFNRHFSAEAGYYFDYYTTPVPGQNYTRNRLYLGVTASY